MPVVLVTWYGAVAYANWLSEQEGLQKCYGEKGDRGNVNIKANGYRLPTEAEWEYACRAGSTTDYYWGENMNLESYTCLSIDDYCWFNGNSGDMYHPVGQKKPNKFGLFDISGNVWEWCSDWYGDYSPGYVKDPVGPVMGSYRVERSCVFSHGARYCRSAYRHFSSSNCGGVVGFRLVRSN